MRRLLKFWRMPSAERVLLCKSLALVIAVRLGLWLIGFHTLRAWLAKLTRRQSAVQPRRDIDTAKVIWAVQAVSRCVPCASCLTQALSTKVLLDRRGQAVNLRIGVAKGPHGQFQAHAWVEQKGKILIGGLKDLGQFTPLPPLEGECA